MHLPPGRVPGASPLLPAPAPAVLKRMHQERPALHASPRPDFSVQRKRTSLAALLASGFLWFDALRGCQRLLKRMEVEGPCSCCLRAWPVPAGCSLARCSNWNIDGNSGCAFVFSGLGLVAVL